MFNSKLNVYRVCQVMHKGAYGHLKITHNASVRLDLCVKHVMLKIILLIKLLQQDFVVLKSSRGSKLFFIHSTKLSQAQRATTPGPASCEQRDATCTVQLSNLQAGSRLLTPNEAKLL